MQWLLDPETVDIPRSVNVELDELIERLASGASAPSAVERAARVLAARDAPADEV